MQAQKKTRQMDRHGRFLKLALKFNYHFLSTQSIQFSFHVHCSWFWSIFKKVKKTGAAATKQQEHSSHIWHESGNILEVIELQTGKPKNSFKMHNGDINETTGC